MTAMAKLCQTGIILALSSAFAAACTQINDGKPGADANSASGAALTDPITLHYYNPI